MEEFLANGKRMYSRTGFALLLMLVITIALQYGAQRLVLFLGWQIEPGSWLYYSVTLLPQYLIGMPVSAAVIARFPAAQGVAKNKLDPRQLVTIGAICLFLMYAGNLQGIVINAEIGLLAGRKMTNLIGQLVTNSDIGAVAVFVTLLAPVAEELFFRKLLIGRLRGFGQRTAVVISAMAFALVHGNISQVFYAFLLGLAFGYIYIHTNRIGYTIGLHIMINLIGGPLSILMMKAGNVAIAVYGLLMLAGVIFGLVQFIRYRKWIGFPGEPAWNQPSAREKKAYNNIGMILFYAVCACLFALNIGLSLR